MSRWLAPFAAAAALLLSGCEVYAVPEPIECPGIQQGVFDFSGSQILTPPPSCTFAQPGNPSYQVNATIGFQGTINFDPATGLAGYAAICISNAHAVPREGFRETATPGGGSWVRVWYESLSSVAGCTCPSEDARRVAGCVCPSNTPLSGCSCPVVVEEEIDGSFFPATKDVPARFVDGKQVVTVNPPVSVLPIPPQLCPCQATCSYSYTLTATAVGAR